ncbi:hypothetical protein TW65_01319 [Stemphylium lycopersici]|nr:hypothetical protein TW65_01319 [Stemphylium lycopersici]
MTNNFNSERSQHSAHGKPMGLPKKGGEAKRRSQDALSPVDEYTQFASYEMPYREGPLLDDEQEFEASTGEYPNSFVEEPSDDQDHDSSVSRARKSMSSYAAPTKASQAKKNEKLDVLPSMKRIHDLKEHPSRPSSAMQRSPSVTSNFRVNPPRRNLTSLGHDKNEKLAKGNLSRSMSEYMHGHNRTRSCSADSSDANQASRNVEAILRRWKQEEEVVKETHANSPSMDDNEYLAKDDEFMDTVKELRTAPIAAQQRNTELEKTSDSQRAHTKELEEHYLPLENRFESASHLSVNESTSHDTQTPTEALHVVLSKVAAENEEPEAKFEVVSSEHEEAVERIDSVQQELQNTKGEIENLRKDKETLLTRIQELETGIKKHDEAVKDELQSNKAGVEEWQRFEEQIEARNRIEPGLTLNEAIEADNERLQAEIEEMRSSIDRMQKELRANQEELNETTESARQFNHEATESNDTMDKLRNSMSELSGILENIYQADADEKIISLSHIDVLMQGFEDDSALSPLFANIKELIHSCAKDRELLQDRDEWLQRKLKDKEREIIMAGKAFASQSQETGMLSPGFVSPLSPGQMDREGFESLFREEKVKRKLAEKKLHFMRIHDAQQDDLQEKNEELRSSLDEAQAEITSLRKSTEDLKLHAIMWKSETEEKRAELEKRSQAFDKSMDQQQQEIRQYIKEYRDKAREEANWEVASLQAKLEAKDREYATLNQMFNKHKRSDARKEDQIAKLTFRNKVHSNHIVNMEQAYLRGDRLPSLQPIPEEQDSASEISSLSPSSSISAFSLHDKPAKSAICIPRCKLPAAVQVRNRELALYRAELRTKTEEELIELDVMAPPYRSRNEMDVAADDIMEKVRKWKMGGLYPPGRSSWKVMRKRSAWEMWDGAKWAGECARGREIDVLMQRGLWVR